MTSSQAQGSAGPDVRVHGSATPEEVAAVVTVLLAAGADGAPPAREAGSAWASRRTLLRGRHDPGPAAWRTTFRD